MANPFVHVELHTHDPEKAKKYYTELFDWKLEAVPGMDYTIIMLYMEPVAELKRPQECENGRFLINY